LSVEIQVFGKWYCEWK